MVQPTVKRKPTRKENLESLSDSKEYRLHRDRFDDYVIDLLAAFDTPLSLSIYMQLKYGEYSDIVQRSFQPAIYDTIITGIPEIRRNFAAVSLLRKNSFLKTGINTGASALTTFNTTEGFCKETNMRLRGYSAGRVKCDSLTEFVISRTIRKIALWLPSFNISEMVPLCTFGPGTSTLIKGRDVNLESKFDRECRITSPAHLLFSPAFDLAFPHWWKDIQQDKTEYNIVSTVPKNSLTDRTIATENGLNMFIQRGLGRLIRKKLRLAGYDLDSDFKNQYGAFIGSLSNDLATVDFSAASDSISIELIRLLLPPDWFTILNHARSHYSKLPDKSIIRSEKFATMGNGFTFELESMVFIALAESVCEFHLSGLPLDEAFENLAVFGDDIIMPSQLVADYTTVCEFLGLTVNTKKTYSHGPFRESCGSYFWQGVDIKPFFIKKQVVFIKEVYNLINSVSKFARQGWIRELRYKKCWNNILRGIPRSARFYGPSLSGDNTIHTNLGEFCNPRRPKNGWCGYLYSALLTRDVSYERDSNGVYLARLFAVSQANEYDSLSVESRLTEKNNSVTYRNVTKLARKRNCFCHRWCVIGDWV